MNDFIMISQHFVSIDSPIILVNVILWIINISLMLFIVFSIFYKLYLREGSSTKRKEMGKNAMNLMTWMFFFLLIALANILMIIYRRFIKLPVEMANIQERISILLIMVAIFIKIIYIENTINSLGDYKGYYFSIITLGAIIVLIIFAPSEIKEIGIIQVITAILMILGFSFLPLLYFYLALKTTGESRKKALETCAGVLLIAGGLLFRPVNLGAYRSLSVIANAFIEATYILGPLVILIGTILIFDSLRRKEIS